MDCICILGEHEIAAPPGFLGRGLVAQPRTCVTQRKHLVCLISPTLSRYSSGDGDVTPGFHGFRGAFLFFFVFGVGGGGGFRAERPGVVNIN